MDAQKTSDKANSKRGAQIAGIVAVVLALVVALPLYLHSRHYESTDDASIDGHIVPIAAKVAGQILSVSVDNNQAIQEGATIAVIDAAPYEAKLAEERAKLASAEAESKRSGADAQRYADIFKKDEISRQQLDNAEAAATAARADVEREKALVQQAELNLSYTKIVAPVSGTVARKSLEPGMYVQEGQALLSIVPNDMWVTANFKETQLTYLRPGQPVTIKVDAYPKNELSGHVDSVQVGTGARFSLFPPENATGNFVKVVQRVPVKIIFDDPKEDRALLAPGMSVEVRARVR